MLDHDKLRYWVDEVAISLEGEPEVTVINLGRGVNGQAVQRLLDKVS